MLIKLILIGTTLFSIVSCKEDKNDATTALMDILQEDIQTNDIQGLNNLEITNNIKLFREDTNSNQNITSIENSQETNQQIVVINSIIEDTAPIVQIEESTKILNLQEINKNEHKKIVHMKSDLYVVQNDIYIKIGNDNSKSKLNKGQKITTVVFPKRQAKLVDIYIYAIPVSSRLVRNKNTLIGYAKNLEFINQQAQFTRYWIGKRVDGSWLTKGNYNIYVESYYKNNSGSIIGKVGRFWGGNHRKWTIKL